MLPEGMTFEDLRASLEALGRERFGEDTWSWVEATEDGSVVYCVGDKLMQYDWTSEGGKVTLGGEGKEVRRKTTYEAVQASIALRVLGSVGTRKYRVRIAASGLTRNVDPTGLPVWFDEDEERSLKRLQRVYAGAKIYAFKYADGRFDHLPDAQVAGKHLHERHEIGYLAEPEIDGRSVFAVAHLHDDCPPELVQAIEQSSDPAVPSDRKPVGLSIDAACSKYEAVKAGKRVMVYTDFRHPKTGTASIDVVTYPAARGEWIARVAASIRDARGAGQELDPMTTPTATPVVDLEKTVKELEDRATAATKQLEEATRKAQVTSARAEVDRVLAASQLPPKAQDAIRETMTLKIESDETVRASAAEAVQKHIDTQREILREADARVKGGGRVEIGAGAMEKATAGLDWMLLQNAPPEVREIHAARFAEGVKIEKRLQDAGFGWQSRPSSLLRLFRETHGADLYDIRGNTETRDRVMASISSSSPFTNGMADAINKVAVAYSEMADFTDYRRYASIVPANDFRSMKFIVIGGYGDLSVVPERENFPPLTTPADKQQALTVQVRGGTEDFSFQAMRNDDVGHLAGIPQRLGIAAARTRRKHILGVIEPGGANVATMDHDATTLYDATHSNTGTTAFDAAGAGLKASIQLMRAQTDYASGEKLGIMPRFLFVPLELHDEAIEATETKTEEPSGTTTNKTFIRKFPIETIVADYWADATNWALAADPRMFPTIKVAFLDGREEPRILVQDAATFGSFFDRLVMTYRIDHIYAATVARHEGLFGQVVAG